jgi:hypothetical protein
MAFNNVDFNCMFSFFETDGTTPLYLTVDGQSGSEPLDMEMWLRQSPGGVVNAQFTTDPVTNPGLSVLAAPNDNQLFWTVPFAKMNTLPANLYYADVIALISDTSRLGYGAFLFPVDQGATE